VKLLRVIQEREVEPVGGGETRPVDFRLISATKKDLKTLAAEGAFREDLYYRLNVIPLVLPTLAERREDIPALVEHFVALAGKQGQFSFTPEIYQAMMNHTWPGNVRELGNVVERMLALPDVPVEELLDGQAVPADGKVAGLALPDPILPHDGKPVDYRHYMQECEDRLLEWALDQAGGNITNAARLLQLPRSTLRSKLDRSD
jgi:DNA-binding NtrC family response regulator